MNRCVLATRLTVLCGIVVLFIVFGCVTDNLTQPQKPDGTVSPTLLPATSVSLAQNKTPDPIDSKPFANPCSVFADVWLSDTENIQLWVQNEFDVSGRVSYDSYLDASGLHWAQEHRKYLIWLDDEQLMRVYIKPFPERLTPQVILDGMGEPEGIVLYEEITSEKDEYIRYTVSFEYPTIGVSIGYSDMKLGYEMAGGADNELTLTIHADMEILPGVVCTPPSPSYFDILDGNPIYDEDDKELMRINYQPWPGFDEQVIFIRYISGE